MNWRIIPAFLVVALFFAVALLFSGCIEAVAPVAEADDSQATEAGVAELVSGNNQFAFDLYHKLNESTSGNIFFSPWSISSALGMTYEGARSTTAEEMKNTLHFPENDLTRRSSFASLYNTLNKGEKPYALHTANALWAEQDFKFLDSFFETTRKYYLSEIRNMDFRNNADASRKEINSWVEQQTHNKIKDLIPSGFITPLTRLVLTNAIYFKGNWLTQFDEKNTTEADFLANDMQTVKVQMMSLTGEKAEFPYAETDELQLLELPYSGEEISMLLILPKESMDLVENSLNVDKLKELNAMLSKQRVDVFIPKFKFETKYFIAKDLAEMGMPTAFSLAADFSGMTGQKDLAIDQVIHQAFVEVNEEGTEAAAATAVIMRELAVPDYKVFRADHPFIFIIKENSTDQILFMGKVANPASG